MTNTTQTAATCDPRPFMRHMALANLWCQYTGQRGTERQTLRIMRQVSAVALERMLTERRVDLSQL